MMTEQRRARQLYRRSAEQLYSNERLRAGLTDAQAKPLLEWAAAEIKQAAYDTADTDEAAAEAYVEEQLTAVSHLLRLTNTIVSRYDHLPPADRQSLLDEFLTALATVQGETAVLPAASRLAQTLQDNPLEATYDTLLQLITGSDEEK